VTRASESTVRFTITNKTGQAYLVVGWISAHQQTWKTIMPDQKASMRCFVSSLVSISPFSAMNAQENNHFHSPGAYTVDPSKDRAHTISGGTGRKSDRNAPQGAY